MQITFIGAAHEVTGSCTYISVGDKRGLVDCGMEQGRNLFENEPLPVKPELLDFILLTHAHIDHSGNLPLLYKQGFRGAVYTTEATANLCSIMLKDSANIQMSEAEYTNRKGKRKGAEPVEPLYDMDDVEGLLSLIHPCPYGRVIQVNDCMSIRFNDVGHLLGSAAIEVWLYEDGETRCICFSGDVGNSDQPILKNPCVVKEADYIVVESTYGDRLHDKVETDYVTELAGRISKVLGRGGNLLIPSFAVGRTQEMLYFIREIKERNLTPNLGNFPVYLDSPLASEATSVSLQCDEEYLDDDTRKLIHAGRNPLYFPELEFAVSQEESKAINSDKAPKVIISASGMCDAGRIRHHLKHNLWRADSMVLFVGYQSEGTLGRLLVEGIKKVKLFGEDIIVNAEIDVLPGVSGHADRDGLVAWLSGFDRKPEKVFVNHGDPDSADAFKAYIEENLGMKAYAPYSGTRFDLLTGEFVRETVGVPLTKTDKSGAKKKVSEAWVRLVETAEKLLEVCKEAEGMPNKLLNSASDSINKIISKLTR